MLKRGQEKLTSATDLVKEKDNIIAQARFDSNHPISPTHLFCPLADREQILGLQICDHV